MKVLNFLGVFSTFLSLCVGGNLEEEWKEWKQTYKKNYDGVKQESYRFGVWMANREKIMYHNLKGDSSYTLAVNEFADLTSDEFLYRIHGHTGKCLHEMQEFAQKEKLPIVNPGLTMSFHDLPQSIDWSNDSSVVTPIKNQGSCGSCWAFSAVGSTESRYALATGELNSLSEQELVDCSSLNLGCDGGNMDTAFYYIKTHSGLALESDYEYTAADGTCESDEYTHYNPISGFSLVEHDNETALMAAVTKGPVSVGIQADQVAFQFYSSGVMTGRCGTNIDHGVVVVGYGEDEESGDKYWKIKNSWGTSWGEDGYARLCRDCDKNDGEGECCVLCQPSYPTIDE